MEAIEKYFNKIHAQLDNAAVNTGLPIINFAERAPSSISLSKLSITPEVQKAMDFIKAAHPNFQINIID